MTSKYEAPSAEILEFTVAALLASNRDAIENRDNGAKSSGGTIDQGSFEEGWGDW